MTQESRPEAPPRDDFAREAKGSSGGVVREVWGLIRHNRKLWLIPVIASLLLAGLIIVLGGTVVAPFIYALF